LLAFLDGSTGEQAVLKSILVASRGAGSKSPAMHAAAFFPADRGGHAGPAGPRLRPAARARQHQAGITRMVAGHAFSDNELVLPHDPVRQ
jgi:hypothetical protein